MRRSIFPLLPTAALNMAHHDWKEMNKDELSELKISHRAEAIHTPQALCKSGGWGESLPSFIYSYIFNGWRINFYVWYLWVVAVRGLCEKPCSFRWDSHHTVWIWNHLSCASWCSLPLKLEKIRENTLDTTEEHGNSIKRNAALKCHYWVIFTLMIQTYFLL